MAATNETLAALIIGKGGRVSLTPGQVLFREGDVSTAVYAVLYGRLKVFLTTPGGRDVVLGVKVPNQVFGELSAVDGRARSSSVVALEPTVVARLSGAEFLDELRHVPELSAVLVRELSSELRAANARIASRDTENATVRVGHLLLELS